jgi:transcription termination factor Rho
MTRPNGQEDALSSSSSGEGVLEILPDGFGFLRDPEANYMSGPDDIYVSPSQIRRFSLRTGDLLGGQVRAPKENERYLALIQVEHVNGMDPDDAADQLVFDSLTPVHPNERLSLEPGAGGEPFNRILDLLAPLGKGQRGLIVAPPRSGKTRLLKQISQALAQNHPKLHQMVLLIDERPEEVTDMERSVGGEVIASTFDESPGRHVQVSEMVIERARRMVESGRDVLILLDSLTRLCRAHNQSTPSSGKMLSGGVDAAALHRPKRFFGAARNIEEGGSLTILATALVETGSRTDAVIFDEFTGAGNLEWFLDSTLASHRIFPSIDLARSATLRDDLLLSPEDQARLAHIRGALKGDPVADMQWFLREAGTCSSNAELLDKLANSEH